MPPDNKPIVNYKKKEIYLNNYYFMKSKSLNYWKQNKILGNGSFSYQSFQSKIASYLKTNDHHSTYFFILASKGILGFIIFLFLIIYSFKIHKYSKNIGIVCILFLLYLLIEGINSNLLTTRVSWIVFAIIGSIINNYENSRINLNI
jgi:O-antigen ligase